MLKDKYFSLLNSTLEAENNTIFELSLLADCDVYRGHFPGMPVAPGVCNIEMIKECAEEVCGCKLFLSYISQCRFSALITPDKTPNLNLRLQLEKQDSGNISFKSVLFKDETIFLDMKGELQHV
ncbi:MAG: beta-hydroxyacyl-ACP dehydratase [Bacteroidia bacterium]|nr:beta-hydroxyacyl-ACP dehydratase [Bacteroidia bacterium]